MSKTITTLLLLAVVIIGGIWLFNRNDGDVALDANAAPTTEDLGTGGPDEGYDPLEDEDIQPKG
jgi:hypothetical protein